MRKRFSLPLAFGLLYFLHFDFWLWQRPDLILGLPVGLLYHVLYCLGVSLALAILVKSAPSDARGSVADRRSSP